MTADVIHPTSIEGIKRLAKHVKASEGIQYAKALDEAARSAGFENFIHARRRLPSDGAKTTDCVTPHVYLTAYWRDQKTGDAGRETLRLPLDQIWSDLVTRNQLRIPRALSKFRGQHKDHLVSRQLIRGQDAARSLICHAARELQFIAATGLRPADKRPETYPRDTLPGEDHQSVWLDPATGINVVVDEPYQAAIVRHLASRQEWATRHRYCIAPSPWTGMYFPGQSTMFLLVPEACKDLLEALRVKLSSLDAPAEHWDWGGESGGYRPVYRSPCEIEDGRTPRAPADPLFFRDTEKTRAFGYRRRPNGSMPIEVHEETGKHIKSVMAHSFLRPGVYQRLDRVRRELDDWLQREDDGRTLDNDRFFAVYYHGAPEATYSRTLPPELKAECVSRLRKVEALLQQHYPACAPLRELLDRLRNAERSLQAWGP